MGCCLSTITARAWSGLGRSPLHAMSHRWSQIWRKSWLRPTMGVGSHRQSRCSRPVISACTCTHVVFTTMFLLFLSLPETIFVFLPLFGFAYLLISLGEDQKRIQFYFDCILRKTWRSNLECPTRSTHGRRMELEREGPRLRRFWKGDLLSSSKCHHLEIRECPGPTSGPILMLDSCRRQT
jgi:hypothetical protein